MSVEPNGTNDVRGERPGGFGPGARPERRRSSAGRRWLVVLVIGVVIVIAATAQRYLGMLFGGGP